MPAPKRRYYSTRDVQTILGVSRSKAIQIMHHFEKQGLLLRFENTMRVSIETFEAWCKEHTQKS